ncbi:MAG: thiamine-phosphate kinase [Phycisphaerales bacterium]
MRESDLLRHIAAHGVAPGAGGGTVLVGPGDDCAVVRTAGGDSLLLTVDHLIEGRHFVAVGRPGGASVAEVACKALARSLSDIAAMGGTPAWSLATAAFPAGFDNDLARALFDELHALALHWACPLVGGDTATLPAGAPLTLTTTLIGTPHERRGPVLRSGARPGDSVWLTGHVGGSLASGRHLRFEPRVPEGTWLCDVLGDALHAMIDVSDGLGRDAGRIAAASGVRIEIDAALVPLHADAGSVREACAAGEDYELLFTAAPSAERQGPLAEGVCPATRTPVARIGTVRAGAGCVMIEGTSATDARDLGWDH